MSSAAARSAGAILLGLVLVLAGCAQPPAPGAGNPPDPGTPSSAASLPDSPTAPASTPPSTPAAAFADALAGRTFEATSIDGRELVPGSTLTVDFSTPGHLGTTAGCNHMGGQTVWRADVLSVRDMLQTEMACAEPIMAQEDWWSTLLQSGVRVSLSGDELTLAAVGGATPVTVHLTDAGALHPDRSLEGTTWRVDGIVDGEGDSATVSSVPDGVVAVVTISDERLGVLAIDVYDGLTWRSIPSGQDGQTGQHTGHVQIDGDVVRVDGAFGGDDVACPAAKPDCRIDISVLAHDFRYRIDGDRLTVTGLGPTEGRGLVFVADPDLDPATLTPGAAPPAG